MAAKAYAPHISRPTPLVAPSLGDETPKKHSDPSDRTFNLLMVYTATMIALGAVMAYLALR